MNKNVTLYCAGGTGINIGKMINDLDVTVNYIDSSISNMKDIDPKNVFLIEGLDGAGKHRATAHDKFKHLAEDVLIRMKPSQTLNIVISSLSGGSGSILGPSVARQLVLGGYNTIVIGIDSRSSVIEIDNSIKTLKTYKAISDNTGKAIAMMYIENTSRKEADKRAIWAISLFTLLTDKNNTSEMDTSDISSFINFNRVTDNAPSVSMIEFNENTAIVPEKNTNNVATILVTKDQNSSIKPVIPEYLSTCIVTDPNYNNADIRIDSSLGKLSIIVEGLEKIMKESQDQKKVNKFQDLEVKGATEDGIIL